jgi:hypothetical protein
MQIIAGLPAINTRYTSFSFVELERRVATGSGTYTSTYYRFVNAPKNITYNGAAASDRPAVGAVFSARNFPNPAIVSDGSLGNSSQIVFDDFDDALKTIAIAYDMLDWRVKIWEAAIDSTYTTFGWMKLKLKGRTEDKSVDVQQKDVFTLDVASSGAVTETSGAKEVYGPSCRFVREFKRGRCLASSVAALAAATCDGQLATCIGFSNDVRYGGFPDAPAAGTVIGVWGNDVSFDLRQFIVYPKSFYGLVMK